MFSLIPKEAIFFDLFEASVRNVHEGARTLHDLLQTFEDVENKARRLKAIEHEGDSITHQTIERLHGTFVTPLDRQDIHELTCRLDDIVDLMDTAVGRMVLYRIPSPTDDAKALGRVLVDSTALLLEVVPQLRDMRNSSAILRKCREIHGLENEGDRIARHGIAQLFDLEKDPFSLIKWKDVYNDLEAATDCCEDASNVIEGIVLKNA